ncbi:MAG: hypothetical protein ACJ77C_01500 [Chloroflexota bacterium]
MCLADGSAVAGGEDDPDGSTDGPVNGSYDMNLYTADLMADERMRDRERDFEASQLAALARVRPEPEHTTRLREGVRRTAGWFRILRRGTAT